MDNAEVLAKIIEDFYQGMEGSRRAKNIAEKIAQGKATYADAYSYARENGRILRNSIQENISDALTEDGRLFREAADVVIRQPMKQSGKRVIETAAEIQQQLNEEAGIGIRAIEPEVNEDQIDGIITGICNAESYDAGENTLYSQIENFLEGTVDDCVHDNADFQYQAGLNPKIERRAAGKCCEWCDRLTGTYDYEDVRNRGNDVFRRHKNCHCVVSYIPGGKSSRRQNVHTRQWTEDQNPAIMEQRKVMNLDLQQFGRTTGDYRRARWGNDWPEGSLKEATSKFTKGAKPVASKDKQKLEYRSKDGRYLIKYDKKGDYFRIEDLMASNHGRRFVNLDGELIEDITEDGKRKIVSPDEYERRTHFKNTDKKGR